MCDRVMLKNQAKLMLRRNYWMCVVAGLLMTVITGGAATPKVNITVNSGQIAASANWFHGLSGEMLVVLATTMLGILILAGVVMLLLQILLVNPLMVGIRRFSIVNAHQPATVAELGCGFGSNYKSTVKTMFITDLYITLWMLLLIVPGIVAMYNYRMVPYLLAEHPEMSTKEAQQRSKDLMLGRKLDAFVLDLSFVGWFILSGLTLGLLGVFYTTPYKMQTDANLYLLLSRGTLEGAQEQNA